MNDFIELGGKLYNRSAIRSVWEAAPPDPKRSYPGLTMMYVADVGSVDLDMAFADVKALLARTPKPVGQLL